MNKITTPGERLGKIFSALTLYSLLYKRGFAEQREHHLIHYKIPNPYTNSMLIKCILQEEIFVIQ